MNDKSNYLYYLPHPHHLIRFISMSSTKIWSWRSVSIEITLPRDAVAEISKWRGPNIGYDNIMENLSWVDSDGTYPV